MTTKVDTSVELQYNIEQQDDYEGFIDNRVLNQYKKEKAFFMSIFSDSSFYSDTDFYAG